MHAEIIFSRSTAPAFFCLVLSTANGSHTLTRAYFTQADELLAMLVFLRRQITSTTVYTGTLSQMRSLAQALREAGWQITELVGP